MDFDPAELDTLSREDLILRARARGVERPEQMTRVELRDEIVRRSEPDLERQRRTRGWLGVARDLLASVVESGLNLPDAAAAIRGDAKALHDFQGPPPVATVTLAEIYAAQGHYEQALRMLDEVIEREAEHATALAVRDRIAEERDLGPGRRRKVVEARAESISTPMPPLVATAPEPVVASEPAQPAEPPSAAAPAEPAGLEQPTPQGVLAAASPEIPAPPAALEPAPVADRVEPEPAPPVPQESVLEQVAEAGESAEAAQVAVASAPALVVLQTSDRAFVYWRLPSLPRAPLLLRSVAVEPTNFDAGVAEQDFPISVAMGGCWLSRFAPGTEVRAAIGELSPQGFSPVVVAHVLGSDEVAFDPLGPALDPELESAARSAAGL